MPTCCAPRGLRRDGGWTVYDEAPPARHASRVGDDHDTIYDHDTTYDHDHDYDCKASVFNSSQTIAIFNIQNSLLQVCFGHSRWSSGTNELFPTNNTSFLASFGHIIGIFYPLGCVRGFSADWEGYVKVR